jgi:hypothetical protein
MTRIICPVVNSLFSYPLDKELFKPIYTVTDPVFDRFFYSAKPCPNRFPERHKKDYNKVACLLGEKYASLHNIAPAEKSVN